MKMDTVSGRLKEILKIRDITQLDFVQMASPLFREHGVKLSPSKFNQYVTGKSTPDQGIILLLAEALDVNPAWLAGWDAPMKAKTPTNDDSVDERMERIMELYPRLTQFEQRRLLAEMEKKASD